MFYMMLFLMLRLLLLLAWATKIKELIMLNPFIKARKQFAMRLQVRPYPILQSVNYVLY